VRLALAVVLAVVLSYPIGLALGVPWLLPILNAAPAYVALVILLRRGEQRQAVILMLVWAAVVAASATTTFAVWPRPPGDLVLHGPEYREEMFRWIRTGVGTEGSPRLFVPQHAIHIGAFVLLSLATGSLVSILMGAVLMNYMAFYVASLSRAGVPSWAVVLLGWQPWAIARVAAFSVLGAVLARPLLRRLGALPRPLPSARPLVLAAAGALLLDVALKTALAPHWGTWLRALLP
jgi:hypothetical protein